MSSTFSSPPDDADRFWLDDDDALDLDDGLLETGDDELDDWSSSFAWQVDDGGLDEVDLEHSDLDHRLRNLVWPPAPIGVRERCLQAVLTTGLACPPPPPVHPKPPGAWRPRIVSDGVQRYELTRRQTSDLARRVLGAPVRQPRFASVL